MPSPCLPLDTSFVAADIPTPAAWDSEHENDSGRNKKDKRGAEKGQANPGASELHPDPQCL